MLPIEIINKILIYIGELNNNIVITQYDFLTKKEYYKINFYTDRLWKIKSSIVMKKIYPIYSCDFSNKFNIDLYKNGISHYEKKLRLGLIK